MPMPFSKRRRLAQQIEQYYDDMLRLAMSWCHDADQARSLVQQSVTTALDRVSQLRDEKALKSWLFTIMNRCFCDRKRRESRRVFVEVEDDMQVQEAGPHHLLERGREIERIRRALAELSDDHRQVVTLIDIEGYSYREVSEMLELRIGTVMSRISRARQQLKESLLASNAASHGDKPVLRRVK